MLLKYILGDEAGPILATLKTTVSQRFIVALFDASKVGILRINGVDVIVVLLATSIEIGADVLAKFSGTITRSKLSAAKATTLIVLLNLTMLEVAL